MIRMFRIAAIVLAAAIGAAAQPVPANIPLQAIRADERERDAREKLPEAIGALGLKPGSAVADIGAGYGYFAVRFSKAVGPRGIVYAEEIDAALVKKLSSRFAGEGLANVKAILGTPSDPHLAPGSVDAVLMADVYHEVTNPRALLAALAAALRPGGRLMIVDYLKPGSNGKSRAELAKDHNIAPSLAESDLTAAGFRVVARKANYAPGYDNVPMWYLVAERVR